MERSEEDLVVVAAAMLRVGANAVDELTARAARRAAAAIFMIVLFYLCFYCCVELIVVGIVC